MFCKNCGQEIDDNADVCIHCGVATEKRSASKKLDNPSHLAGAVSCCFPVVGLVLYFLWKDEKPNSASLICKWMIGGIVAWVIFYVLFFVLGIIGSMGSHGRI
ncbi:zinc ribbon domain-containing protein [Clostridium sp.]|uniref:zinc ribbon domain-containing protein n=1 Tax=Clostridium sp. TaxID=1506 RepID=UPI002843638D|nr:zinc ribbon domain-containing protein [Clostridium sp.]MDR3598668.1 zinc ribbon domain-containing protein [Clostridium sp.]